MNLENIIRDALNELTKGGTFQIDRIDYDEKNFGNIIAVLRSNNQVDIRLIRDKGIIWCEVGKSGQWYFIEDVCALIGVAFVNSSSDFIDYTKKIVDVIKANEAHIFEAFNNKNSKDIQTKIKAIATQRAMGMFKK